MLDLALDLDVTRGRQVGLEDALRRAVRGGQLVAGVRLPSSRALAAELGWARATVVGAYEQLAVEGYLQAERGSGTVVAAVATEPSASSTAVATPRPRLLADFRPGEPDRATFPRRAWLTSLRSSLVTSNDDLFGYGDAKGLPLLRQELAAYLGRSRAVVADPERIVVFPGFASALSTLTAALQQLGSRVLAVEDPCLPFHPAIAREAGLQVRPIPVDDGGIRVAELRDDDAVLVTPAHQYPMGVTLRSSRRAELVTWAREHEAWIIEDDYDGELRYDRQSVGALQGLDPARVVYAGTTSKMLAPGVALAWLVLPDALVDAVVDVRRWRLAVSSVEQAAFADFIRSGRLDRHLRQVRVSYRRRRDALVRALPDGLTVTGVAAGLHVTMLLPPGAPSERALIDRALAASVSFHPLGAHQIAEPTCSGLVIGYGRPPAHAFPAALDRLARFFDEALS